MRFVLALFFILGAAAAHARELTDEEKGVIAEVVRRDFKDPDSAQFRWLPFQDKPGGLYCGMVNGRNSYGAYVGFSPYSVVVDAAAGKVTAMLPVTDVELPKTSVA